MLVKMETGASGGGEPTISMGELSCYNNPVSFTCQNAMYFVGTRYGSATALLSGYIINGVHTNTKTDSGTATYQNGVLTLNETYHENWGLIFIVYY